MSAPPATKEELLKWAKELGLVLKEKEKSESTPKLDFSTLNNEETLELSKAKSLYNVRQFAKIALLNISFQHFLSLNK